MPRADAVGYDARVSVVFWLGLLCGVAVCAVGGIWYARRVGMSAVEWVRARFGEAPGDRGAERQARDLLRSCLSEGEWAMYRDLGFIRVPGRSHHPAGQGRPSASYAYLVYPHKPIVSYLPHTGRLLSEYSIDFGSSALEWNKLSASDDVLVKWMGLTGNDRRLLQRALVRPPGHRHDCRKLRRDLWRLSVWERETGSGFDVIESPPR